jgi:hypothetical protein
MKLTDEQARGKLLEAVDAQDSACPDGLEGRDETDRRTGEGTWARLENERIPFARTQS